MYFVQNYPWIYIACIFPIRDSLGRYPILSPINEDIDLLDPKMICLSIMRDAWLSFAIWIIMKVKNVFSVSLGLRRLNAEYYLSLTWNARNWSNERLFQTNQKLDIALLVLFTNLLIYLLFYYNSLSDIRCVRINFILFHKAPRSLNLINIR